MNTDRTFKLRLLAIEHGWLQLAFEFGNEHAEIIASVVLNDPIETLISTARFLNSSQGGTRQFEFYLEPDSCRLFIEKVHDAKSVDICLEILERPINLTRVSKHAAAIQIWRTITQFEKSICAAVTAGEWPWRFPSTQMSLLSAEIQMSSAKPSRG